MANAGGNRTSRKKVLIEVNINWKPWQPKIQYENMIEVDVRVKAELFFSVYYSNVGVQSEEILVGNFLRWENLVQCTTEACYCSLL